MFEKSEQLVRESENRVFNEQDLADPMRHGFIYPIVRATIEMITYLSLVELFKAIGKKLAHNDLQIPRNARIGIDVYLIFKWVVLVCLWVSCVDNVLATVVVIYLLATNVFTYFYYHVWKPPYDTSEENLRSRLVTLILSIFYSVACFGYLYAVPFAGNFRFNEGANHTTASVLFSASQTFLVDFAPMSAITYTGYGLALFQTAITFMFISIILAASIPEYRKISGK
jgi:hypothetical protein